LLLLLPTVVFGAMQAVPQFTVSLDVPASERWAGAVQAVLATHSWENSFGPAFVGHNISLFNSLTMDQWSLLATSVRQYYPEYALELQGISQSFAKAGYVVTFEYLCGWVWFHELAHSDLQRGVATPECTGIIGEDANKNILHARNMDQSPTSVRNITLHVTFMKEGEVLFDSVDWYWFTAGVMTAVRKGVTSLQENWRFTLPLDSTLMLSQIAKGITPQMYLFRNILSTVPPASNAFETVVAYLSYTHLAAPLYFVVGGFNSGQGVIITRNNTGPMNVVTMPSPISLSNFSIVQTNYEPWLPDNPADARRTAAQAFLAGLKQTEAASELGLFAVLSSPPVLNEGTAYSVIMRAATGELHAFIRS